MKLADMGGIIWLIIVVGVALVKGWSKLQQSTDEDSSSLGEAPPVTRPKPRIPPPRPRLQPRPVPAPIPGSARLPPPAGPRATPPPVPSPVSAGRKVGADDIRRFIEQLSGQSQPAPPVVPPPIRSAEPPPPPPKPEPAVEAPVAPQTIASAPAPAQTTRAAQWMEALRDRNNIRNIIISAEIIGPPRAESM